MSRKLMAMIIKARQDLDAVVTQMATDEESDTPGTVSSDLLEIRARVKALESRVDVIEERGEH